MMIAAMMAYHEVSNIMVEKGSLEDVIFLSLLTSLGISVKDLIPYRGVDLTGFDDTKTIPHRCLRSAVTYGKKLLARDIDNLFLVLPCRSV